tara:strand:- start:288 stop:497 length:210 start_codon:yes stop_codon:yes gene_type:complete
LIHFLQQPHDADLKEITFGIFIFSFVNAPLLWTLIVFAKIIPEKIREFKKFFLVNIFLDAMLFISIIFK